MNDIKSTLCPHGLDKHDPYQQDPNAIWTTGDYLKKNMLKNLAGIKFMMLVRDFMCDV